MVQPVNIMCQPMLSRSFFEGIAGTAKWLMEEGRKIEEIKVVFLVDIFDT